MLKWLSRILTTVLSGWILHDRLLHRLRSWSWHFLNSDISQGSVVTQLRCGEISSQGFVANLLVNLSVKEVWKLVNIWRSYCQYCSALFFLTHSVDCHVFVNHLVVLTNRSFTVVVGASVGIVDNAAWRTSNSRKSAQSSATSSTSIFKHASCSCKLR